LAFGTLAFVGASLGLCVGFFFLLDVSAFVAQNASLAGERNLILAALGAGTIVGLLVGALLYLGRSGSLERVCRVADLLSPLCVSGFIPILFYHRAWTDGRLTFLALLGCIALVSERLFARSISATPEYFRIGLASLSVPTALRRYAPAFVVVLAALSYAVYFSHFTLLNHRRFGTSGFDLGINVNWCFNALHGHPFRATVLFGPDGGSMLAGHAIYAVFFWLPFYAIKPGAEVLLIYQATMVGLAAIPLYLFGSTQLPRWSAATVALGYLLYAPLHGPNFYDFHELLPALPWHFLFYWLIATNRMRLAALVVPILWAHREDVAVGVAIVGVVLFATGTRPRFGAWLAVSSTLWFVVDKFIIMPAMGTWFFSVLYKDLIPSGQEGYGPVVQTILVNPTYFLSTLLKEDKLVYFLHLFVPLVFLPLRRPLLALLAMPGFFFTLMTTAYHPTLSIGFQYTTHWIPYLFAGTVIALRLLGKEHGVARRQGALCAFGLAIVAHSVTFGAVFQHESFEGGFQRVAFEETPSDRHVYAGFKRLIATIPAGASVAATESEVPHVAARINAYTLKSSHGDADYLLVRNHGVMEHRVLQEAFDRNEYGLVGQFEDTFYLFKKDHKITHLTRRALIELGIHRGHAKHEG
jgi:uncharacterized membrane protein